MAEEYVIAKKTDLDEIADKLRKKSGGSGDLSFPQGFVDEIDETMNLLVNRSITSIRSNCKDIGHYAFFGCTRLESVDIPNATSIEDSAFLSCTGLKSVDFPNATSIEEYAFQSTYSLTAVILRGDTICTLSNINGFKGSCHIQGTIHSTYNPDGLKDGYFYVPSALVEKYKTATNWSTYADRFRALEDYTVDGTTTGELDETKI